MRIESLISAVDAAGYAMVSEEDFPEVAEAEMTLSPAQTSPTMAVAVWKDSAGFGKLSVPPQIANAWGWLVGRFASGAAA